MSREMKHSGVAWIGEIPTNWNLVQGKRIFHSKKRVVGNDVDRYERLALTMNGVIKRAKEDNEGLQPEQFEGYQILGKNELVFKLIDLQNIKTSRVGLSPYVGIVSPAYITLQNNSTDNRFYYYWYMFLYHNLIFNQLAGDGVRSALNADDLLQIPIPNIPFNIQQAIADFLDKKCNEIDELVALQEKMIEELKAYKQSVITEAVCKGLNPNVPMKDSGVDWIGDMPKHWEIRRLKYIGKSENGLTYSPNDLCDNSNDGILVLLSSNIQEGKLVFTDNVYVKDAPSILHVKKGDIILCSRNGSAALVGKSAIVNSDIYATFGAFMMRFRSNHHTDYIHYLLTAAVSQYKQLFSTTTINQLTIGVFGNLGMPFVVSRIEQQEIADYLDKKCSEIDQLISIKQQKIVELNDYKKSLIYEYATGKKEVKL